MDSVASEARIVRVFISSTYEDLREHREQSIEAVRRLSNLWYPMAQVLLEPKGMEEFPAQTAPPKEVCLERVRESDIYIGIIGMRYGCIDPDTEQSLTHLEYEEAQTNGLQICIYLMDEDRHLVLPKFVDKNQDQLEAFKEELRTNHTYAGFATPRELYEKVLQGLVQAARDIGVEIPREVVEPMLNLVRS